MISKFDIRKLQTQDLAEGHAILIDAFAWLEEKKIRLWTAPVPLNLYRKWLDQGCNYGLFLNEPGLESGELAVVFSLVPGNLKEWNPTHADCAVLWIHSLATSQDFRSQGLGQAAVRWAIKEAKNIGQELYLSCVYDDGFLTNYYKALGFFQIDRELKHFEPYGNFDMVLMKFTS